MGRLLNKAETNISQTMVSLKCTLVETFEPSLDKCIPKGLVLSWDQPHTVHRTLLIVKLAPRKYFMLNVHVTYVPFHSPLALINKVAESERATSFDILKTGEALCNRVVSRRTFSFELKGFGYECPVLPHVPFYPGLPYCSVYMN